MVSLYAKRRPAYAGPEERRIGRMIQLYLRKRSGCPIIKHFGQQPACSPGVGSQHLEGRGKFDPHIVVGVERFVVDGFLELITSDPIPRQEIFSALDVNPRQIVADSGCEARAHIRLTDCDRLHRAEQDRVVFHPENMNLRKHQDKGAKDSLKM